MVNSTNGNLAPTVLLYYGRSQCCASWNQRYIKERKLSPPLTYTVNFWACLAVCEMSPFLLLSPQTLQDPTCLSYRPSLPPKWSAYAHHFSFNTNCSTPSHIGSLKVLFDFPFFVAEKWQRWLTFQDHEFFVRCYIWCRFKGNFAEEIFQLNSLSWNTKILVSQFLTLMQKTKIVWRHENMICP